MKSFSIQAISHAGGGLRVSDCILLTLELLLQKSSLTPKVLIPTERLMGYSQTCHPGCVIIPTDSNRPTVAITSCVIIHRLLTLSFHSRIRSRFYLYINKIPSEGFFFLLFSPVFILKISILLSRVQFSLFSNSNLAIAASSLPLPPQPLVFHLSGRVQVQGFGLL